MNKEDLQQAIKEYLKESLGITVWTEKYYGDYGSGEGVRVTVILEFDGEELARSYDYTSL